jgi:hypothetical protein
MAGFPAGFRFADIRRPSGRTMKDGTMGPDKKQQLITGLLMTTAMALTLSGFFSLIHVGLTSRLLIVWPQNFLMGWPVGFVVSALVASPVKRIAARLAYGTASHGNTGDA